MDMAILRRQGDLLFKPVRFIPQSNSQKIDGDVVAHGENGHQHKAKGGLVQLYAELEDPNQISYIDVKQKTVMEHEEHNKIDLPAGKYVVVHEREYDPFAEEGQKIRQVID